MDVIEVINYLHGVSKSMDRLKKEAIEFDHQQTVLKVNFLDLDEMNEAARTLALKLKLWEGLHSWATLTEEYSALLFSIPPGPPLPSRSHSHSRSRSRSRRNREWAGRRESNEAKQQTNETHQLGEPAASRAVRFPRRGATVPGLTTTGSSTSM